MNEAIVAIISLVIGAFLQYIFNRLNSKKEKLNSLLSETCIDYLESVTELKFDTNNREKQLSRYLKAKERIILFGSKKLIDCLYGFESTSKILDNEQAKMKFVELIKAMRISVFNESVIAYKIILKILFSE